MGRIFAARSAGHVCVFAPGRNATLNSKVPSKCAGQGSSTIAPAARTTVAHLFALQAAIPGRGAFRVSDSEASISLDLVQKWFRKGRDYMTVYKQGATGQSADKAQRGVKSHRRALSIRGAEPRERIDVEFLHPACHS